MNVNTLNSELAAMSTAELVEKAKQTVSDLCKGGKMKMCVPVQVDDSDMILSEVIRRVEGKENERLQEGLSTQELKPFAVWVYDNHSVTLQGLMFDSPERIPELIAAFRQNEGKG